MKRVAIPSPRSGNAAIDAPLAALKQNVEMLTGQHANAPALRILPPTATLGEVIAVVNALVLRMQGDQ